MNCGVHAARGITGALGTTISMERPIDIRPPCHLPKAPRKIGSPAAPAQARRETPAQRLLPRDANPRVYSWPALLRARGVNKCPPKRCAGSLMVL